MANRLPPAQLVACWGGAVYPEGRQEVASALEDAAEGQIFAKDQRASVRGQDRAGFPSIKDSSPSERSRSPVTAKG